MSMAADENEMKVHSPLPPVNEEVRARVEPAGLSLLVVG
jgi:hypothetical protein